MTYISVSGVNRASWEIGPVIRRVFVGFPGLIYILNFLRRQVPTRNEKQLNFYIASDMGSLFELTFIFVFLAFLFSR